MQRTMIPVLLLTSVALSTGVVVSRLQPPQPGLDPGADQSSDSDSKTTDCENLRKLYRISEWLKENHLALKLLGYNTDDKQERYNEYNKGQGVSDTSSLKDTWHNFRSLVDQSENYKRKVYYPYQFDSGVAMTPYYEPSPQDRKIIYIRNNDILIRDDNAYYLYDTYMATTHPFDFADNANNCLYETMSQPTSYEAPETDADENLEMQEERERLNTNEITPLEKQVDKRNEASETGEKEVPDDLVFNEGGKDMMQKKLFSFWSRLQALSHKGRQVPIRRHTFVYYGPDGDSHDGPLTAETRASHLRPPGQPLRWG